MIMRLCTVCKRRIIRHPSNGSWFHVDMLLGPEHDADPGPDIG